MQGGARRPENDAGSNLLTENGKRGTGVFFRGRNLLSGERRFLPRPPHFEESRIAVRLAAVPSGTPRFRFIDTYCETRERRKSGRIAAKADLPPGRAANPLFHRLLFTAYLKIYSSCRPSFSAPSSKKAALLSVWRPCRPVRRVFVSPIRIVKRANGEKAGG